MGIYDPINDGINPTGVNDAVGDGTGVTIPVNDQINDYWQKTGTAMADATVAQDTKDYWQKTGTAMADATVAQDTKDYWQKTGTATATESPSNTGFYEPPAGWDEPKTSTVDEPSAPSTTGGTSAPVDTRTQAEKEADFYNSLKEAKTAAANGDPQPLKNFDSFFNITRNPDEYKKAFYADYTSDKLNATTEQEIKQWFIDRDANNDGMVSLNEMGENARKINESLVGTDGKLSVAEGIKYHEGRVDSIDGKLAISGLPKATQDEIRNWHMERDLNKDGSIQQSEISSTAWNAQFDGVRDDGKITVEESINRHRKLNGMPPIDWNTVNSGDISPVATGTLSQAERTAMASSSTVAPTTDNDPVVSVPEAPVTSPKITDSIPESPLDTPLSQQAADAPTSTPLSQQTADAPLENETASTSNNPEQITQQETALLKDFHNQMTDLGLGFNEDGSVNFDGAKGKDPDAVAELHKQYDSLSATEKQILAATWDPEFDTTKISEDVKVAAGTLGAESGADSSSGLDSDSEDSGDVSSERGNSEDKVLTVGNETAAEAGSDANRHTKTVRTGGELDIEHPENSANDSQLVGAGAGTPPVNDLSGGETLASQTTATGDDKVYVAKGGSVTKMIQDLAAENGQQLSGKEAWKIYEAMKEDLAKMDNTYKMQNGHVGLSSPGEMKVDSSIVSKIRDLSSGEGALQAARIEGTQNMPTSLGQESSSMGLASGTQVRNNSSGSSGIPSMP